MLEVIVHSGREMLAYPTNVLNGTSIKEFPAMMGSVDVSAMADSTGHYLLRMFLEFISLSTLWKALLLAFLIANAKNLPLVYHLRLLNAFRFVLHSLRTPEPPSPDQLFQPLITSSQCPLAEIDLYMHKSNSSYFTDVDIARTHLICTLFARGIEKVRGGTGSVVGGKVSNFAVALGAVSCSFRKELKPYEKYDLYTRVLSWDQKWLYVVTHFVKKGAVAPSTCTLYPQQKSSRKSKRSKPSSDPDRAIVASALSKLVFKKGRVTIAPEVMLEASGLLPEKVTEIQFFRDRDMVNTPVNPATTNKQNVIAVPTKVTELDLIPEMDECESPSTFSQASTRNNSISLDSPCYNSFSLISTRINSIASTCSSDDGHSVADSLTTPEDSDNDWPPIDPLTKIPAPVTKIPSSSKLHPRSSHWSRDRIERERRRGMQMANLLGLQAELATEFTPNAEALGMHTDGCGVKGVISTLAQLGHLTRKSSL